MFTRGCETPFGNADVPVSRFDIVIEYLLAGLLIFMPFAFGVVHRWSEEVVVVLSGAIAVCFLLKLICHRDEYIIWSWVYVPLVVFLFVVVLQLVPLPSGLLKIISPNTVAVRTELLSDLPDAGAVLKSMPISFYPNATRHGFQLLLAAAAIFVVVLNVFRRPDRIKRLLTVIVLVSGAVALIALGQNLFGNGKIYWFITTRYGRGCAGPFVNHSNFGQFMNLSIGAAIGLIIVRLREDFAARKPTAAVVIEYLSSPSAGIIWFFVAIISLGATAVFVSLTRGGIVSMLIAAALTTLLLCRHHSLKGHCWVMIVVALAAFICVLYTGFDAVYERLATLRSLNRCESRWQMLNDLLACYKRFPLLGTGLGTHSVVYPMFDRSTIPELSAYAENEYAQTAEETGIIGLGTLVTFGIIVCSSYIKIVRSNIDLPVRLAVYGLGFGILAILVHSLSDFGQHLPANIILTAIFCSLILALAPHKRDESAVPVISSRYLRIIILFIVGGIWVWALIGADNARIAESCWEKVVAAEKDLGGKNWQGSDKEFTEMISNAAAALKYQPQDVQYRYWLNVYRWRSVSRLIEPDRWDTVPESSKPTVYNIVSEFQKARTICPTYGAVYCVLGQIERFVLDEAAGAEKIRKGFLLAPCDPAACFAAGVLDIEEDKADLSLEKFERAIRLDSRYFETIVETYVNRINRPDLAVAIAADDSSKLSYVASVLARIDEHRKLVDDARAKVTDMLKEKCLQPDAPDWIFASLAAVYEKQNCYKEAIDCYRRALALNYGQVQWRLELARLLAVSKEVPQAIRQARICLRLQPQLKEAEKFIAELSVQPAAFNKEVEIP